MYIYANVPFVNPAPTLGSKSSETTRKTTNTGPEKIRNLSSDDHDGNNYYFSIMSHLTIQVKLTNDKRAVVISIIYSPSFHADDFIPCTTNSPSVSPAVLVTAQARRGSRGRGRGLGPQQHQAPEVGRGGGLKTRQLTLPAAAGSSHAATSRPGPSSAPAERLRLAADNLDGNFP